MGTNSKTNPELSLEFKKEFEVEHYQRPISDYFNTLIEAGFKVKKVIEPEFSERFLEENPRFEAYRNHPVGLIFYCLK